MGAATYNLTINQGVDYRLVLQLNQLGGSPVNLAEFTGKSQIRDRSDGSLLADFDLSIDPTTSNISLSLSHDTTSSIRPGFFLWDLLLADSLGTRHKYIKGNVLVIGEVTQWR